MKRGVEISRPQEPRWMGLSVGILEKYLLVSTTAIIIERVIYLSMENCIFSL